MCRIAGIISAKQNIQESTILRMRDAMQHGGPDDAGIYIDADHPLAFGHRRLSLIDLSALGHQPMQDASGQLILIFNGEIYNFQVIRAELEQLDYVFRSNSDTEVILYAYQQWGKDCLQRFNGMFAFALLDKHKNTVLLARDHAGIKPLYYGVRDGQFCFASEVRAFTAFDPSWPENNDWRKYFLLFGHLPEPITTLQDVQPLAKGHWLEYNLHTHQYQTGKFFQLYYNYTIHDEETAVDKVRAVLRESVQRHLISDAPIGLFLSGGLDSSLLTLLAKPVVGDNLHTLSIVFENDKFSEKLYQDIVIQATGAQHRSFLVTEKDFFDNMPDIIKAMDQPSNDGINSYFICRYAKAYGLKAVLSGLGADELFGGYPTFNRTNVVASVRWLPDFMFAVTGIFPDDKRKRFSFLQVEKGLGEYLFNRGFFLPAQVASLLDCSVAEVESALEKILLPEFVEKLQPEEKVSFMEANLYMQNQLLKDTDYMSMWHSVEVRVPFLDKQLMELAYSINPDIRFNSNQGKHLLIKAFKDILPEPIWNRPKQGFVFPFEQWMQHINTTHLRSRSHKQLHRGLVNGKIHWSRYWCYLLAQKDTHLLGALGRS